MKTVEENWVVYLLRCSDGTLYCGVTNRLEYRLKQHNAGRGAKYTRSRTPVGLVGVSLAMTKSEAFKLEYRVKQVPAERKLPLLSKNQFAVIGDLCRELESVARELDALSGRIKVIMAAVDRRYTGK